MWGAPFAVWLIKTCLLPNVQTWDFLWEQLLRIWERAFLALLQPTKSSLDYLEVASIVERFAFRDPHVYGDQWKVCLNYRIDPAAPRKNLKVIKMNSRKTEFKNIHNVIVKLRLFKLLSKWDIVKFAKSFQIAKLSRELSIFQSSNEIVSKTFLWLKEVLPNTKLALSMSNSENLTSFTYLQMKFSRGTSPFSFPHSDSICIGEYDILKRFPQVWLTQTTLNIARKIGAKIFVKICEKETFSLK